MTAIRLIVTAMVRRASSPFAIGILALALSLSTSRGALAQEAGGDSPEAIPQLVEDALEEDPASPFLDSATRVGGPWSGRGLPLRGRFQLQVPIVNQGTAPSPQSGLQLGVAHSPPISFGYRVMRYHVMSPTPAVVKRPITLKVIALQQYEGPLLSVEQDGELPQGATEAVIDVTVPWFFTWPMCHVDVWVDGKRDPFLSVDQATATNAVASCNVLWGNKRSRWMSDLLDLLYVNGDRSEWMAPLAEFPDQWVHYSSYDMTAMSGADWIQLVEDHPRRAAALMRWVRTGGTLWLFDADGDSTTVGKGALPESSAGPPKTSPAAGEETSDQPGGDVPPWPLLAEVDRALQALQPATDSRSPNSRPGDDTAESAASRWRPLRVGPQYAQDAVQALLTLDGLQSEATGEATSAAEAKNADAITPAPAPQEALLGADGVPLPPTTEPWLQVKGHGLGLIVATERRRSMIGARTQVQAQAIEQSMVRPRLNWPARFGFAPGQGVEEFNNWLLPGVGMAPVGIFQVLTTLFVLAIGPLNYYWLKRQNNLPLLVATVPAGAAAATLLMFGYGMFADGWGVQVRARSLTLLDQAVGEATCWARLTYYAATAPDGEFQLPKDVVLCPLKRDASGSRFRYGRGGEMSQQELVWGERQELARGWLAPRTPTQYLQVFSRPSARRLSVTSVGEQLRVRNGLGVDIRQVFLEDASGRFFAAENLADSQAVTLSSIPQAEWIALLRRPFAENAPDYPVGASPSTGRGGYFDGALLASGLMESRLSAISSPTARRLGPRTFVAVTAQGVELDLGFAHAKEDASFHVVKGSW